MLVMKEVRINRGLNKMTVIFMVDFYIFFYLKGKIPVKEIQEVHW